MRILHLTELIEQKVLDTKRLSDKMYNRGKA